MIKKIFIFLILAFALMTIADYYGIINISIFYERPQVLQVRDEFVLKTSKNIDPNSF